MFSMKSVEGDLVPGANELILDKQSADDRGLSVGSTVTVQFPKGHSGQYTVSGIYERSALATGIIFGPETVTSAFTEPGPIQAYIGLTPGTDEAAVKSQVERALQDDPELTVITVDDLVAQQAQIFRFVLIFVQLLLGLAMIIAVLGIINTLALSMTERTRELGLLRAVGMKRGQVMWMVTVESVVISVFGALLGIAVGAGLGTAVFQALRSEGFGELAFPWLLMAGYVVASILVGLVAGLIPAIRAARQDVLQAIAYE